MRKLLMFIATMFAAVAAMAQSSFYVVMKDGSAEKFPVEKVDSLTFENIDAEKVLGMGDLMKVVDALKSELDSLKGENAKNAAQLDSLIAAMAEKEVYVPTSDKEYVDLGLDSKTLWATCNVGATKPEEFGDYYAWGETETKDEYTKLTSVWDMVSTEKDESNLKKQGVIDANGNLKSKYDASLNKGLDWRMPTDAEVKELLALENEPAEVNGVNGRKFIGKNGNTLFLPFAGYRDEDVRKNSDKNGFYWTSTAFGLSSVRFSIGNIENQLSLQLRYYGYTVRPVKR